MSVIVPVYNGARYVREAIDSALRQTHPHVEVIAVDDGSTDESAEILASYGSQLTVSRQPNCGNVGFVRKRGVELSSGEYIAFLDQDDWWEPTKVMEQLSVFESRKEIGLVHTNVRFFDEESGRHVGAQDPDSRPCDLIGNCFDKLIMGNAICNSSVLVRRSALDRVEVYDPHIEGNTVQDYGLWIRLSKICHFGYVDHHMTNFRLHPGQGHKDRRSMLTQELKLLERLQIDGDTPQGYSARLGRLLDGLAVAHLDANQPWVARRYFTKSLIATRSLRSGVRFAASWAPSPMIAIVRRAVNRLRGLN